MSNNEKKNIYKLVLVGDSSVGKSSIVSRFVYNKFNEFQETTIGAAFAGKNIYIDDKEFKIQIWDTAGQERYRSLTPMYYRNSSGALVVYDTTNNNSFTNAKSWVEEIKKNTENCHIILVGNKLDLPHKRQVSEKEIKRYIDGQDILYIEVSAKTGINIENIFINIIKKIEANSVSNKNESININQEYVVEKKSFCQGWF